MSPNSIKKTVTLQNKALVIYVSGNLCGLFECVMTCVITCIGTKQ